jgi:microcystin-dependent protein
MPLETATYISDLVVTNPANSDGLNQADDHMRLIKSAVKTTFLNITGAVTATHTDLNNAAAFLAGTVSAQVPLGAAATPSYAFAGNLNTGIYSPGANQVAISVNGVQALRIAADKSATFAGNVSITGTLAATGAYSGGTGQLVPIGAVLEWYDDTLPAEGGYCWANGQIIASANTVCPVLLARWGSRFGGNGTTTMGVPDRRDTVGVGKSTMGGVASRALQTLTNTVLNTLFGEANHVLTGTEMPSHFHAAGIFDPTHTHGSNANAGGSSTGGGAFSCSFTTAATITAAATGVRVTSPNGLDTTYSAGGGATHNNVQPSTTCNYILRLG